jgi:hypothetical protein
MKKLEDDVKEILDLAGSVIADKGFQGFWLCHAGQEAGESRTLHA